MDSDKHCGVVSRWIFKEMHLEKSILPRNDLVLSLKIGLEMTLQQSFEVQRLNEATIDGRKSVPAMFGGHFQLL